MLRRKQSVPKKHDNMGDSGQTTENLEINEPEIDQSSTSTATTDPLDSNPSPLPDRQLDSDDVINSADLPQDLSLSSASSKYSNAQDSGPILKRAASPMFNTRDDVLDLSVKKRRRNFCDETMKNFEVANFTLTKSEPGHETPPGRTSPSCPPSSKRPVVSHRGIPQTANPTSAPTPPKDFLPADFLTLANYAALSSLLSANNSCNRSIIERDHFKLTNHSANGRGLLPSSYSFGPFNGCSSKNANFLYPDGLEVKQRSFTGNCTSPTTTLTGSTATGNGCSPSGTSSDGCSPMKNGCSPDFFGTTATDSKRRRDSSVKPSKVRVDHGSPAPKNSCSPSGAAHPLPAERATYHQPISYLTNPTASSLTNFDALSKLSNLVSKVGSGTGPSAPYSSSTVPQSDLFATPSTFGRFSSSTTQSTDRLVPLPPVGHRPPTLNQSATAAQAAAVSLTDNFFANAGRQFLAGAHDQQRSPSDGVNFHELWWKFVKKEENAEMKRLNEAKQIFTCLQCQASFQTMDQLVKHMEATQHYTNIPKHYSWSLQYARQKMRQMKMKMKYSDKMMYFCFLCQSPFTEPVQVHFNLLHSMHNPAENMKYVQIMSCNKNHGHTHNVNKSETKHGTSNDKNTEKNKICINFIAQSIDQRTNDAGGGSHHRPKKLTSHQQQQKNTGEATNFGLENASGKNGTNLTTNNFKHCDGNAKKFTGNDSEKLIERSSETMRKLYDEKTSIFTEKLNFCTDGPLALLQNIVK